MIPFEIVRPLGEGAFGATYVIRYGFGEAVLKVLKSPTPENPERFAREARMLARHRDNPHVLLLLEHELDVTHPYIVTEHCNGGSLERWVRERQRWEVIAKALAHVAAGLDALHLDEGFHRDIKPANLLLLLRNAERTDWVVKIADFGLARQPETVSPTMTASPWGTPAYMPPEARLGGWTRAGDVYSLGVTGIELLTGQRVRTALERTQCPDPLKKLLRSMTNPVPSRRPSIRHVGNALQGLLVPPKRPVRAQPNWAWLGALGVGVFVLGALVEDE